jgi:prepilin-type N-terminal cleavage/methylation domain-containing protein
MRNRGITLIELLVVITIIGILAIALGFEFVGWQGRYRVESQIKQIESDLMKARASAMQRNRTHFVNFPDTVSYTIYEDTSNGAGLVPDGDGVFQPGTGNTADDELDSFPKTLDYALSIGTVAGVPPITFTFDRRGLISPERTICMFTDFDGDAAHLSDVDPDYDCIVLSATRINLGNLTTQDTAGGLCDATNCVQR